MGQKERGLHRKSPPPDGGEAGLPSGRTGGGGGPADAVVMRQRARALRKAGTDAEHALWARLRRGRLLGRRFRRQHPLGRYIVDLVCLEGRLVVEVDGSQHLEQQRYDDARQRWLESQGYRLLRFWNNEVLAETDAVVETIAQVLDESGR